MQGVSPSAEGDRGAPPLDPASAQVGAGPALDTLADFYSFVAYFSSVVFFSSAAYSARGKAVRRALDNLGEILYNIIVFL